MASMLVRHEPASAALVRHELARELLRLGVPQEAVDEAVLVASELLGNAIRHTPRGESGMLDIGWDADATGVTITVADASSVYPHPRTPRDDEPGGRGLTIIEALSDTWGVQPLDNGKRVWAHLPTRRVGALS
jgi:anti-sigma regulatory factor (Ser/Thr protein kinase)